MRPPTGWPDGASEGRAPVGAGAEAGSLSGQDELSSRALPEFLQSVCRARHPVIVDLGAVVGSNVSFFSERTDGTFRVEDLHADIERHAAAGGLGELPTAIAARLTLLPGSVHGILAWDVFDFLPRPAAVELAGLLTRAMAPDAVLLAIFNAALHEAQERHFTRFVIGDAGRLSLRTVPTAAVRQAPWQNRDIVQVFPGLRVATSTLMRGYAREILYRKPAYLGEP